MKSLPRRIIANVLVLFFLVITLSPLISLSSRCAIIAHALTGECTGDCDTCGCSPERRASHTCCCQNTLKMRDLHNERRLTGCCKKFKDERVPIASQSPPCGKGKSLLFRDKEEFPVLPHHFNKNLVLFCEDIYPFNEHKLLACRTIKPPVPPPELSILL